MMQADRTGSPLLSDRPAQPHNLFFTVVQIGILTAVYFVTGKLGLQLAFLHQSASAVWPPTGISLAAILLLGRKVWPGISIGAFLVNLTTTNSPLTPGSVLPVLGIALGNTLEALIGARLVERFANGKYAFEKARDTIVFILVAAVISTVVSPTLGVTALGFGGLVSWDGFFPVWLTWWLGDAVSAAMVAPLLIIWVTSIPAQWIRRHPIEASSLLGLTLLMGVVVFGGVLWEPLDKYPTTFLCFPLLFWAAYRFGQFGAVTVAFITAALSLWGTLRQSGPFWVGDANDSLLLVQAFVATIALSNLVFGVVMSERQLTDQALRTSESVKGAVIESALDSVITMNDRGLIVDFNPAAESAFGYRRSDVLGRPVAETIIPERLREAHMRGLHRYLSTGEAAVLGRRVEMMALRADGGEFPVELAITATHVKGRPVFFTAYIRDISERKRAERRQSLQLAVTQILAQSTRSDEALSKILQAVGESLHWCTAAIWTVDRPAQVLRCIHFWRAVEKPVPAFEAATRRNTFSLNIGLPGRVWATGKPAWIADVVHDSNFPRAPYAAADGLHGAFGFPIVIGGQTFGVMEFFSEAIEQPDDAILAMMATIGAHIGQFLERRRAEDALKEADRRKDHFIAILSHELRNPLAPIRLAVALLRKRESADAELSELRDIVDRQVTQMTRLLDDLLDISRITADKINLRRERMDLAQAIESAVEASRPLIDIQNHDLTVTVPAEKIEVCADLTRLSQVFSNLLNNSAKYTPPGGRIWISAGREAGEAVVRVRDTGIGISSDKIGSVFDIFVQGDNTLERGSGGLGIGLTLVRLLVERHGGTVDVRSEGAGRGCEFTVRLPILDAQSGEESNPQGASGRHEKSAAYRILVADDNYDSARVLEKNLTRMGHDVSVAHNGAEALERAAAFRPDVALLDIGMPKLNGYEVARRIRSSPFGAGVFLIAMTGWGQEDDKRRALEAGFDLHLTKPTTIDQIEDALLTLHRRSGSGAK